MSSLIDSLATLAWPAIVLAALLIFRRPLLRVVRSAERREWTLEVGGQRLTMQQLNNQQVDQISDLQRRLDHLSKKLAEPERIARFVPGEEVEDREELADIEEFGTDAEPAARPHTALWVDANPKDNALLIEQLQRNGVQVDVAKDTSGALQLLDQRRYGVVLSGMGRIEHGSYVPDAGLQLLHAAHANEPSLPVMIFAAPNADTRHCDDALAAGAAGVTASHTVLASKLRAIGLLA